jgi:RNA polymerase sigma factor (sigma-70 family)
MPEVCPVEHSSIELFTAFRDGDPSAAEVLFGRYRKRLVALAARRMSRKLQRRIDPEDLFQSVCMVFLRGVSDGRYHLRQRGDLWSLLVQLTINRLRNQIGYHTAAKRSVYREQPAPTGMRPMSSEPSPEEAAILVDEIRTLLNRISNPKHRHVIEMGLQGCCLKEIASMTHYSQERIRQILKQVTRQYQAENATIEKP